MLGTTRPKKLDILTSFSTAKIKTDIVWMVSAAMKQYPLVQRAQRDIPFAGESKGRQGGKKKCVVFIVTSSNRCRLAIFAASTSTTGHRDSFLNPEGASRANTQLRYPTGANLGSHAHVGVKIPGLGLNSFISSNAITRVCRTSIRRLWKRGQPQCIAVFGFSTLRKSIDYLSQIPKNSSPGFGCLPRCFVHTNRCILTLQ